LSTSKKPVAQNKKWARTHRTRPPRSEQAVNYTERQVGKQVDDLSQVAAKTFAGRSENRRQLSAFHYSKALKALKSTLLCRSIRPYCNRFFV